MSDEYDESEYIRNLEAGIEEKEQEIERLRAEVEFYKIRCELLYAEQVRFREPERTVLCNVLANGDLPWEVSDE